jgi:hypothetical protein
MLTKKQIRLIADEFRLEKPGHWDPNITYQWERDVRAIGTVLKVLHPKLDLQKFYKDCTLYHPYHPTHISLT